MTDYGYGKRCDYYEGVDPSGLKSCLSTMLAASAQEDMQNYDDFYRESTLTNDGNWSLWGESLINYNFVGVIVGHVLFRPVDNASWANGVAMYGINVATAETISGNFKFEPLQLSPWDSVESMVLVDITIPVLTSQCIQENTTANTSSITIQNDTFRLPIPVSSLTEGQIVAQIASDNSTFVLSFGAVTGKSKKHCALHLFFQNTTLRVSGGSTPRPSPIPTLLYVDHKLNPWNPSIFANRSKNGQYLTTFSQAWLEGMGWSEKPTTSAIAKLLSDKPITADWSLGYHCYRDPLKFYTLVLLSSGISAAFLRESVVADPNDGNISTRNYTINKREFYIGIRSPLWYFLMFIIVFDSVFVLGCLVVIMQQGWFPDWADSTILLCAAFGSHLNKFGPHDESLQCEGGWSSIPSFEDMEGLLFSGREEGW